MGIPKPSPWCSPPATNANGPLAYLTDWNNHDVRTEGMSYGMMISVELNQKAEFDALWNWAKTYMYIGDPHHPSYGYFSWSCKTDGTPNEETAAPDGEEYFVMSLYFAAARWGSGAGIYNYKAQADQLLTTMRHREVMTGPTRFGIRSVGNEVDEESENDPLCSGGKPRRLHRSFVSSPGLLRAVGALGTSRGSGVLGRGRRGQPGFLCEDHQPRNRTRARLCQL